MLTDALQNVTQLFHSAVQHRNIIMMKAKQITFKRAFFHNTVGLIYYTGVKKKIEAVKLKKLIPLGGVH